MKQIKKIILSVLVIVLGAGAIKAQNIAMKKAREGFNSMLKKDDIHNGFLEIQSADGTLNWKFIDGTFQDGTEVNEANPFHAASIGKMFTATAIMKLAEEGKLQLNDFISEHLPAEIVNGIHVYDGEHHSHNITIAQLLQHTSGLPDYLMDTPKDGSPDILSLALQNPSRFWKVKELLAFSKEKLSPHFLPGQGYYYTDTEYVLLGLIIEAKYQKELHQVFLDEFFEPLAMKNTAMFMRSEAMSPSTRLAELYVDEVEISTYASLSIDWAGGGLVTTTEDLLKFQQALFAGEIVSDVSLGKMQNWIKESEGMYYGYGLRKIDFKELSGSLPPMTLIGHSGANASFSFLCPELSIFVVGTFNQTNRMEDAIRFLITTMTTLKIDSEKNEP